MSLRNQFFKLGNKEIDKFKTVSSEEEKSYFSNPSTMDYIDSLFESSSSELSKEEKQQKEEAIFRSEVEKNKKFISNCLSKYRGNFLCGLTRNHRASAEVIQTELQKPVTTLFETYKLLAQVQSDEKGTYTKMRKAITISGSSDKNFQTALQEETELYKDLTDIIMSYVKP